MQFYTARYDTLYTPESGCPAALVDTILVPWWSFTKTVLATAVLKLVEQGVCSLDDDMGDYPYTLRHLLQHRAGVPNYGSLSAYHEAVRGGDLPWPVNELLDRVNADQLDFEPGQGWRYSNVGYLLVRRLIELKVNPDLGVALRRLLFDPMALQSVRIAENPRDLDQTAWANTNRYHPGWVYHGLLIGTPGDAVRFLHQLMTGAVLCDELLSEMVSPHPLGDRALPNRPWRTTGYGLGLMIGRMEGVGAAVGHSGSGTTSVCSIYHFSNLEPAVTVAAFARGQDEGTTEFEAVRLAVSA